MMKQAQQLQKRMQDSQAEFEKMEFDGTAGNGSVNVKIMGTGFVKSINIDKSVINSDEKDILEDLIVVAFNNARKAFDEANEKSMTSAAGGVNLKNFKLPF